MKLSEVFERAGIEHDDKARRVLNTSSKAANITAAEIEAGVTLERLESVGVPAYRYNTQITLHGSLPDFAADARPAGYKAVFRNGNGTVGVKYVAIDAEKKRLIHTASRLGTKGWTASINCEGLSVGLYCEEKEACMAAFRSYPRDLVCGGVAAGAGMLGGYWVVANVGAVPEANVWAFIGALWGIQNKDQLDALIAAREARAAEDNKVWQAQHEAEKKAEAERKAAFIAGITLPRLKALPKAEGGYVRVVRSYANECGFGLELVTLAKRGGSLCFATQPYPKTEENRGFKKFDGFRRRNAEEACKAGQLYAA